MLRSVSDREWDASCYEQVSTVQEEWAERLLDLLDLRGDETVLDAGCGSGRVTRRLLERLPRGHVVAVDASEQMVAHAREALEGRATVLRSDLTELELEDQVDAVFSNAVFHWIADHDALFAQLRSLLRPRGKLVAGCGGKGNLDGFWEVIAGVAAEEPFAPHLRDFEPVWWFPGAEETERRLLGAGFSEARAWIELQEGAPEDAHLFLRTVPLRCHLQELPDNLADPFVSAVLERTGRPLRLRFRRLQMLARA
jgi:trans-aconitate 2-methyltransferase